MRHGKKRLWLLLFLAVLSLFPIRLFSEYQVREEGLEDFSVIKTPSFTIYYEPTVSLDRVYKRLSRRRFYVAGRSKPDPLSLPSQKVAFRLNILFERVKEILGIYTHGVYFVVKIYKNPQPVYDFYRRITMKNDRVKAFYSHEIRTIFTSEETISDSVLAHEMAHVLEHYYFAVPPSSRISEMLAVHVDSSLDD